MKKEHSKLYDLAIEMDEFGMYIIEQKRSVYDLHYSKLDKPYGEEGLYINIVNTPELIDKYLYLRGDDVDEDKNWLDYDDSDLTAMEIREALIDFATKNNLTLLIIGDVEDYHYSNLKDWRMEL